MVISLSDSFDYKKLIRFTLPSIMMMVFTSIYGVVDGFFVSNYAGKTEFAALNFIMPFLMLLGPIGFVFGTGGSALIAKTMGEGNTKKASRLFSMIVYVTIILSVIIAVFGIAFIRPIAAMLGAEGKMLDSCVIYGRIILIALPFQVLQIEFESFFVTAERPKLGLYCTVITGVLNMVLDFVFLAVFNWSLAGAAAATAISQTVGALVPLVFFSRENTSPLRLEKPIWDFKALLKAAANGSSEFLSGISMSVVGMLYNVQLLKFAGENAVAAYGVLMYVNFIFISVFIGYSVGVAPVISYHFGAKNEGEVKSLIKKSLTVIAIFSAAMFALSRILAHPLSSIFVSYDKELFEMTVGAFMIFSFSFLFSGLAIFSSSFFTALNDGLTSAVISFLRTLVFESGAVLILPLLLKLDGIWLSGVVAECAAAIIGALFILLKRKKYNY